jgi:hypothetical protein
MRRSLMLGEVRLTVQKRKRRINSPASAQNAEGRGTRSRRKKGSWVAQPSAYSALLCVGDFAHELLRRRGGWLVEQLGIDLRVEMDLGKRDDAGFLAVLSIQVTSWDVHAVESLPLGKVGFSMERA